jgi:hypothetical protein
VYLGGVVPRGRPSLHLRSRLETGEMLRSGRVPAFELRAAMVIGRQHDLAHRPGSRRASAGDGPAALARDAPIAVEGENSTQRGNR